MTVKNTPYISVVSPVFGCKTSLAELYLRLKRTLEPINPDFEIILVNDASPDEAWEAIVGLADRDPRVKGINLSRNSGQHNAITAGLDHCKGEWVVVIDCDLQDQPEEIIGLYNKAIEGYDAVYAQSNDRQDGFFLKISSKIFYRILSYLTDSKQDNSIANYGIYRREIINELKNRVNRFKYFQIIIQWLGFRTTSIPVRHDKRTNGETTYNIFKKIKLGIDVILSFSEKPLKLIIKIGLIISLISFIVALGFLILTINGKITIIGYSSLIISIWFLAGIIIMLIGIVGLYLGKTFTQVKNRQTYIIKDFSNLEKS